MCKWCRAMFTRPDFKCSLGIMYTVNYQFCITFFKWLYQPSRISIWYMCVPFKSYSRTCWSFLTWTPDVLTLVLDKWCQYLKIYANKSCECTLYTFVLCIMLWFKVAVCESRSPLLTGRWSATKLNTSSIEKCLQSFHFLPRIKIQRFRRLTSLRSYIPSNYFT